MKRPQSVAELKEQLSDQMGFLLASAEAFDGGDVSEAKRLAVALRVLLHESKQSHSLLGQLGQLQGDFWDLSFPPAEPGNLLSFGSLIEIVQPLNLPNAPAQYMAPLDDAPSRLLPFKQWWEAKVFQHPDGSTLSSVFNVNINGAAALTGFDIVRASGAKNKAIVQEFTRPANSSGAYVIQFSSVTNQSLVSGIEIQ